MKRIIGILTVICMMLSFCPASFAAESGVRYDFIVPDSLGYDKNGVPTGGVQFDDETAIRYRNTHGNAAIYTIESVTDVFYVEFKMQITDENYNDFRYQLVDSTNAKSVIEPVFSRQSDGTTNISPKSTYYNSNNLGFDAFKLNEWVTICTRINSCEGGTFDLTIKYSDGTEKIVYKDQTFNKVPNNYDIKKVQFCFNSQTKEDYAGPAYFKDFNIYKLLEVAELTDPEDEEADINSEYTLPSTVTATLENGATKELDVTWESSDIDVSDGKCTFTEGKEYTFIGTVAESDKTVTLKVNVTKLPEIEELVNPTNGEAEINVEHTLPSKVTANYDDGVKKEVNVTWVSTNPNVSIAGGKCTFAEVGTYTFEGVVNGTDKSVYYTVEVKPVSITDYEKVDVYLERHSDAMPKTVKVGYRNGSYGFEAIEWDSVDYSATDVQTITGTIKNYDGEVNVEISADVYLYDAGDALFEEACNYENGEHLGNKYLSPLPRIEEDDYWGWDAETNENVVARPDPKNTDNTAIYIPVRTSELTLKDYSFIEVGTGREGISIVSFDLLFPNAVTSFVTQLISENGGKVVEHNYDASTGKMSNVGDTALTDAFESDKWVNFKWIVNMYTDTYDLFINNIKVSSQTKNRTEKQKNIHSIRFANKSAETDGTAVYVDNIKMYHLTAMLEDEYEEVKLKDIEVTENLSFNSPSDTSVTAVWESADTSLIENNGVVHFPAWKSGEKSAKVTLTLSKDIGAGYSAQKKTTFDLLVKEAPPTDSEAVNATLEWLNFDVIKKDNTSTDIFTDLSLPAEGLFGTIISWSGVNSDGPIDSDGKVYAPEKDDELVTLTATVSKGSATEQKKSFNLTVKYQEELSDLQAVRRAKAQLSIEDKVNSSNTKLSLPSSSANGVSIAWKSLNTDKLSDKGEWQKPSSSGTAVMQAVITKGTARETKEFNISVAAYSAKNNGGGSSSGGGGGGKGGSMIAPGTTPTITEPEKITPVYSDINGYDWAHTAIYALTNAGVITGTGDKKFEPARNVKREEFVAMAVRGFGINGTVDEFPFADVAESDWHYATTKKAYGFGLVSGIDTERFGSGMEIKRQDMFVIMYNAAKKLGISLKKVRDASEFADSSEISEYAVEAVTALYEAGIINGYGDSICPLKSATRAEAAKMIYEIRALYI